MIKINILSRIKESDMKRADIYRFLLLHTIGNFLILFALFGVGSTFGPAIYFEITFHLDQFRGVHYQVAEANNTTNPTDYSGGFKNINTKNKLMLIPKDTFFSIVIPKIGANAKIIPNVDPSNETEYLAALKQGVAHAKGSVFPGMIGTTYLFAHSTDNFWDVGRYNAVFYLLKDLNPGDKVSIFFKDRRYNYTVTENKITDANDISALINAQKTPEQLIMQTCWPPGTTLKRILVTAKPDFIGKR